MKRFAIFVLLAIVFGYSVATAQEPKAAPREPKTKLEAFEKQTGMVLIKGFSTVGSISGMGSVAVECREFIEASTRKKQYGIVIEVSGGGKFEREDRSFIDYDEIEPLIKGIDYIAKVGPDSTKLGSFEAVYKTKGDLSVITFSSSSGKIEAAVKSGYIGAATAYISTAQLMQLRSLIVQAKQKLDSIK